MIPRRQFIQSLLSALAVPALPLPARALPTGDQAQPPSKPGNGKVEWIDDEPFKPHQVKLIGVGGAGGNTVNHMVGFGLQGVELICANTDAEALAHSGAHKTIQLGNSGLGAGDNPDLGREAAAGNEEEIRVAIEGADMLFITAGMGGGTGTGAAPVIARMAKSMGILTVGLVSMPFAFEGIHRLTNAQAGLTELQNHVDALMMVDNEKLLSILGDGVTQDEFFGYANDLLKKAMVGMVDVINLPNAENVDFTDVHAIMGATGGAVSWHG